MRGRESRRALRTSIIDETASPLRLETASESVMLSRAVMVRMRSPRHSSARHSLAHHSRPLPAPLPAGSARRRGRPVRPLRSSSRHRLSRHPHLPPARPLAAFSPTASVTVPPPRPHTVALFPRSAASGTPISALDPKGSTTIEQGASIAPRAETRQSRARALTPATLSARSPNKTVYAKMDANLKVVRKTLNSA